MGDLGSKVLQAAPSGTIWTVGTSVSVAWGIRYNHGGGYAYRLCPANSTLSEECFAAGHLEFERDSQELQWKNGTKLKINGTFVDTGTTPKGSTWAMNPIPRIDFDSHSSGQQPGANGICIANPRLILTSSSPNPHLILSTGYSGCKMVGGEPVGNHCRQFDPPCSWDHGWYAQPPHKTSVDVEGNCSGDWTGGMIVDHVKIPKDLKPGDYVLGWRWDCEESTQVWSSCADVTVIAQ